MAVAPASAAAPDPRRWRMLAVLFLARTAMGAQFQSVASVGPALLDALHADYAAFGALVGLYMLPGTVLAVPGGLLGQRWGDRRVVLAGLALMALGSLALAAAHDLGVALAARGVSGAGAVLLNVLLAKLVADWFGPGELATAMGILVVSWPLGIGLGLVGLAPVAQAHGWAFAMVVTAAACGAAFAAFALGYRAPASAGRPPAAAIRQATPPARAWRLDRREWQGTLLAGVVWALFNVGYIVVVSFAPVQLAARGLGAAQAALVTSFATWPLVATIPLGGWLADRTGRGAAILLACLLGMAAALPFMLAVPSPLAMLCVIGLLAGPPAAIVMSLPGRVLRPASRHFGMGVYFALYYLAMAVLPGVAGWLRERSGVDAAPLVLASGLLLVAVAAVLAFERVAARGTAP